MTHYHFSTLGQCLISLAKQGITSPLKRVLRFIEAGAIVPLSTDTETLPTSDCKESPNKSLSCPQHQKTKTPSCAPKKSTILSGLVKVDFSKAKALLDQINLISTSPIIQDAPLRTDKDQKLSSQSSWTSISDDSDLDVPTPLPHCQDQPELPITQSKNDCTITLENILSSETKTETKNQQQNHEYSQPKEPKKTWGFNSKESILENKRYEQKMEEFLKLVIAAENRANSNKTQKDIQLPQVERRLQKDQQQQQQTYEKNQQLHTGQTQKTEQDQIKMTDSPLNNITWPQKDITELAKKLEKAAAANEAFQIDLNHLVENVFMDKSIKKPIRTPVTNETNLLQLRYATSFQYLPCDLYNLSIGFITMKGRKQITTVDDTFLRKHTVGELFESSELTHGTTEICDLFQIATMEELMDYFNEKVLKREKFSKEMYAAVEEIAKSVLMEIENDENYQQD